MIRAQAVPVHPHTDSMTMPAEAAYQAWRRAHELTPVRVTQWRAAVAGLPAAARVHLLVLLERGEEQALADTLAELPQQITDRWQITVLSTLACPAEMGAAAPQAEWITLASTGEAEAMARAAVQRATADWCAVLAPGDRLAPQALAALLAKAAAHPSWQFIYVDEDRLRAGEHTDPQFKPDFNLDLLRSAPYLGETAILRRTALEALPGVMLFAPAAAVDTAWQVHDRFGESAIGHVAEMLLHRPVRVLPALHEEAVKQALTAHLARRQEAATVVAGALPGTWRVQYRHAATPLVSIIIPTRDRLDLLQPCIESLLEKTRYKNYEIIVVDNQSRDPATLAYLDDLVAQHAGRIRVLRYDQPFNYADMNNRAAEAAHGEFLLLLNNDTRIIQNEWLERMLMHGQRPAVGAVGARLVFPDGRVQHAGVVLGMGRMGIADHVFSGLPLAESGYMNRAQLDQNYSAVTAACLLLRRDLFLEVGGFDTERFKVLFNDVDLCLRIVARGKKIVWTPGATVLHYGSLSQRQQAPDLRKLERVQAEKEAMIQRWCDRIPSDPAWNPHLTLVEPQPVAERDIDPDWREAPAAMPRLMGYPLDHHGCGEYRVMAPLRELQRQGLAETFLLPEHKHQRLPSPWELARAGTTTLLLQSPGHDFQIQAMHDYRALRSVFKVFELDDLKTALPEASVHKKTLYGDIGERLRTAASLCDRMVVATQPLKDACRDWHDDIVVVPNSLERDGWTGLRIARNEGPRPRVGWAGGLSHAGDLALLADVLPALADEVDFVFFGMCPEALRPYVREHHAAVRFPDYPAKLASLGLDLALAPLEVNAFNECKSNLKLLEYGILGWPVIATDIEPYRAAPVTRAPNTPAAWIDAIRAHLDDRDHAARQGAALRQWVEANGMLEAHAGAWQRALCPDAVTGKTRSPS